jgi:hypothetical protein
MSGMLPDDQEIRRGLRESRPDLYQSLLENGTLDEILQSLHAQAKEAAVQAIADGLAPDQAMEVAREVYRPLMEGT